MSSPNKYPFLFLLIPVIGGILWNFHGLPASPYFSLGGLLLSVVFITISYRRVASPTAFITGVFTFLFFLSIHRSSPEKWTATSQQVYSIRGECLEKLSPTACILRHEGLSFFLQSPLLLACETGDVLECPAKLLPLSDKHHLFEFDFNQYLRTLGVQARALPCAPLVKIGESNSPYSHCQQIRNILLEKSHRVIQDSITRQLIQALCLGYRQEISPDIKNLFQETGTIHLLAVSGLHMGVVFLFLSFLLQLFSIKKTRHVWILLPALWLFAGITGLSPSACRAASILSFITIGQTLRRDHTALNTIGVSAFFTLLLYPHLLFSISFQMSYAAYTGIILLYPLFHSLYTPKHRLVQYFYSLGCVSLAAQITVLPLTAYYFHAINLNSLWVNLLILPLGSLFIYGGLLLLLLPASIGSLLAGMLGGISHLMVAILHAFLPLGWMQKELYPTVIHLLFLYFFIYFCMTYWKKRERPLLIYACATLFTLLVYSTTLVYIRQNQSEIIVFHRHKHSSVLLNHNGYYTFLKNNTPYSSPPAYVLAHKLSPLPPANTWKNSTIHFHENRFITPKQHLYIVDQAHRTPRSAHTLIITENISPAKLQWASPNYPTLIILDGSNTHANGYAWETWCSQHNIRLKQTNTWGSYIVSLK